MISRRSLTITLLFMAVLVAAVNEDCSQNEGICDNRYHCTKDTRLCKRDGLFPLVLLDYFGIVIMAVLMSLSIAAGLGGGEIVVPIIKILFGFSQTEAAPISQCCIMLAGITRFIINYKKKHPHKDAVPIDYNAAMVLMPAIFFGASIGQMLHEILPNLFQEVMLLVVLGYCVFESCKKGMKLWKQESKEKRGEIEEADKTSILSKEDPSAQALLQKDKINGTISLDSSNITGMKMDVSHEDSSPERGSSNSNGVRHSFIQRFENNEKSHWQFGKLIPIWLVLAALIGQAILKDSGLISIEECSLAYWAIYVAYVLCCAIALVFSYIKIKKDVALRQAIYGDNLPKGEVKFDNKKIISVVGVSVLAGCVASVIGVGGGVIYLPMLLIIGYPPFVASSTSIFMVMYAAAANFISYTIGGQTNIPYAFWLGLWTCIGVVIGVTAANKIVQKTGSIFIILLGVVMTICFVLTVVFATLSTIDEVHDGEGVFKFGNLCD